MTHHQEGTFAGGITDPDFVPNDAVPVELEAGSVSIHHARLLHGSAPNESGRRRRLLLHQYCAGDAWPLIGHPTGWDGFVASFLRGAPAPQPRLEAVPVRLPLPTALRPGSIYETQTLLRNRRFAREVAVR